MKVKHKIFSIGILSFLPLILITYFIFRIAYFGYINKEEEQTVKRSFNTIQYIINNEKSNMKITVNDWAHWDQTYNFIKNPNKKYIDSNLQGSTLKDMNLKMMTFVDNNGNIIYSIKNYLSEDEIKGLNREFLSKNYVSSKKSRSGLLVIKNKAFLASESPVIILNKKLPSIGSLIIVREIDKGLIDYIKNVSGADLIISEYKKSDILHNENFIDSIKINLKKDSTQLTKVIKDFNNKDTISFKVMTAENDYENIGHYFNMFSAYFLLLVIAIVFFDYVIINKYILKRLSKVTNFIDEVAATKDTTLTIRISGKDEFNKLALSTNKMLLAFNNLYNDMKIKDERFRMIMNATNDGYLDLYVKTKELYMSPEWKSIIEYDGEDGHEMYKKYISIIHPDCLKKVTSEFLKVTSGRIDYFCEEYKIIQKSGSIIWVLQRGKVSEKDKYGKPTRVMSTLTNITDRKKYEEEILFLSYSDKLTGLKNRAYMENEFDKLDRNKKSKYFIIMGDLNGFKLINDALGHREGDKLICAVSKIIKEACEVDDIVSRWGGDEFIVLIKDKDERYADLLVHKINKSCEVVSKQIGMIINIALGYAEKNEENMDSESVMSLAEKRMYRNKLIESKSARSATLSSLLRTLHEKSSETEQHTMRIKYLSSKLGKRIGLTQDKLDELELLALLHDIGKIGIPEQILNKPGKLTDNEWEIMKTHAEIGYRIAESTQDLAHIADEILAHHEKYDGTGYPSGLRGEEIPLLSRIVNIVDSFDVMTHKRIYKDAATIEYAIEEIKRCAGKQFDPRLANEFLNILEENN